MKTRFLIVLLSICLTTYGQIKFEKGYFINSENQKTECLIKDVDWRNNPERFTYKLEETAEEKEGNLSSVSEFGTYAGSKYVKCKVKLDKSGQSLSELSYSRNPEFVDVEVFLKVLEEGTATLYFYRDPKISRLFFKVKDSPVEQLIYKDYYTADGLVATNTLFRQQLFINVNCNNSVSSSQLSNLSYSEKVLSKYFRAYNECVGDTLIKSIEKKKRDFFNLRIIPGVSYSTLSLYGDSITRHYINYGNISFYEDRATNYTINFDKKITLRLGLQAEFILPFNKNKWSFILEPTFEYFKAKGKSQYGQTAEINYKFIELPVGLRYYIFLNDDAKIFLNGLFVSSYTLKLKSNFMVGNESLGNINELNIKESECLGIGAGLNYKKISAEIRYTPYKLITDNVYQRKLPDGMRVSNTLYSRLSLIIGFKLF